MRRVLVIGCPGAGKSTLTRALAETLGLPAVYLDRLWWKSGWINRTRAEFDARLDAALAASALGLGSVWICYFQPEAVKAALGLPEHLEPVNILAVGYADGAPASPERWRTERIPLDELVLARA